MANCDEKGKILPLKIGLSQADKLALEETIYNRVVGQIEDITISGVRDNIQMLRSEFPNGTGGIWITKNDGQWNYYDIVLKDWVAGGMFIEEQEITNLESKKRDNETIYSNDNPEFLNAMKSITSEKTFYTYFYDLRKSTTNSWLLQLDNLDNIKSALSVPEFTGKGALSITRITTEAGGFFLKLLLTNDNHSVLYENTIGGWLNGSKLGLWKDLKQDYALKIGQLEQDKVDLATYATGAGGLEQLDANVILAAYDQYEGKVIQFYSNEEMPAHLVSYGFVMTALDRVTKSLVEIDRDGVITKWTTQTNVRMGGEIERGLNYRIINNHTLQMNKQQVDMMKGLRVWIEYEYGRSGQQRNVLIQCQDIRFTNKSSSNFAIGVPLANPNNFSDMLVLQYKRKEAVLEVSTSNTNQDLVPTSTKIVDVKGIY